MKTATQDTIIYRLPIRTEKEMQHAERRQRDAYAIYDSVEVILDGVDHVKIVCTKKRMQSTQDIFWS
jgi:hypothetical protein